MTKKTKKSEIKAHNYEELYKKNNSRKTVTI